ncbi:MAG: Holliday junction DNA helicase RuvA [Desulfobacterales bacterium]|nr:Holliday junction DNA helicase RuvA [Desulfobacterales bacterium]
MIAYLEGNLLKKEKDRIILLVNHVGYEILIPAFVMETLNAKKTGDFISFYIYYHQTEKQPKPLLIGFNFEAEKEFFQYFITVEAMGPVKAVKALDIPISNIAKAIETKNLNILKSLKGIGDRTAQKIIASLEGKMAKFALIKKSEILEEQINEDLAEQVIDVMVNQLGHSRAEAKQMVTEALKRNSSISKPEELFDEVYRGSSS